MNRSLPDRIDSFLSRNRRIVLFCLCVLFVLGFQSSALYDKILEVPPTVYFGHAVDLDVTPEYRYGYVWTENGAFLVKTPGEAPVPEKLDGPGVIIKGLDKVMRRELELIPLKTILELALYVTLLGYAFFGVRRLRMRLHIDEKIPSVQYCFGAATWMIFWTVAFLPLGLSGYGEPLHSNVIGPGALACRSPLFSTSPGDALTVSYRDVMNSLSLFPLMLGTVLDMGLKYLPSVRDLILYNLLTLGLLLYGMVGMAYNLIRDELRSRKRIYGLFLLVILLPIILIMFLFPPWRPPTQEQMERIESFLEWVDPLHRPYTEALNDFTYHMRNYNTARSWPKTLPEAVQKALSSLSPEAKEIIRNTSAVELIRFHHGWRTRIGNDFGLWEGNKDLLRACGSERMHPDNASMVIILAVWKELREEQSRCDLTGE